MSITGTQSRPRVDDASDASDAPSPLPCPSCEYDLRGQPIDGRCPECGEAVARAHERLTLHHADPRWLRRIILGFWWVPASFVCFAVIQMATAFLPPSLFIRAPRSMYALMIGVDVVCTLLLAAGPWIITTKPSQPEFAVAPRSRRLVRVFLVAAIVLSQAQNLAVFLMNKVTLPYEPYRVASDLITIAGVTSMGATFVLAAGYARALLLRLPRSGLILWTVIARALLAVGFMIMVGMGVAQMVARDAWFDTSGAQPTLFTLVRIAFALTFVLGIAMSAVLCVLIALRLRRVLRHA